MATKKNQDNSSIGQFFTPSYVAEFMVKNLVEIVERNNDSISLSKLKVLEPSAGEGIFLKYLSQCNFSSIIAYEMDNTLKEKLLKSYPKIEFRFKNFFSSNPNERFDLIIGNPPYLGQNYNAEVFQEYIRKYPICAKYFVGNMDLFYYFIHLGIEKLRPGGLLSFITTNYWITKSKKTGIKFLKPHIVNDSFLIQYFDLSDLNLFPDARGQHNCIFVLQKKTEQEKLEKIDKDIEVIKIKRLNIKGLTEQDANKKLMMNLLSKDKLNYGNRYFSALSNKDLKKDGSWNLLFPKEIKDIVDYIEDFCITNDKKTYIQDLFMIRNGIIFPKDEIFILQKNKNIKFKNKSVYIAFDRKYIKIHDTEVKRLKKIYKSKSIKPFGYNLHKFQGYAIYLNKNEFLNGNKIIRNQRYLEKYPNLTAYLRQYEQILREILENAKENPDDFFFPRRGAFIKKKECNKEVLLDLEPLYDNFPKIFFRYITNENKFGFTDSSYYATSDTYFLWPKCSSESIDYPFIVAYLNSKIVSFLFTAKNISIKRSKTKLEEGIPIPNLNYFRSEKDLLILSLIRHLARRLMHFNPGTFNASFYNLQTVGYHKDIKDIKDIINTIVKIIEKNDYNQMIDIINRLFFELFELDEQFIEDLLNKYY
ncbi:MAG: Eco57I restriction-modification methylase domain-containing protein [Promethearchaeota archaeon]